MRQVVGGWRWGDYCNARRCAEIELENLKNKKVLCACCGEEAELKICDCSFGSSPNYKLLTKCCESTWEEVK